MEINFTTITIVRSKINASIINNMLDGLEYIKVKNVLGCWIIGTIDGIFAIIIKVIIIRASVETFIIMEDDGIFGVMATKYENRTNMPLI